MIKLAVADFIIHFFNAGKSRLKSYGACTYFPDNELVVILATERCQVIFVVGERETLDQHLVHLETVLQN